MTKKFVFDTNSLISANLLSSSINRTAINKVLEIGGLIYSETTIIEFAETFIKPKFDKYVSIETRKSDIAGFKEAAQLIEVNVTIDICRDPKDNKFLELAVEAGAACIITGDKDLLVLHPYNGIPILTAADFMKTF
jgi:putative PIN family toxin of toxin-antitoxin system